MVRLFRTKQRALILILLGWMLYLPIYLLTFFRPGYFYLPFTIFYVLGAVGISELVDDFEDRRGRLLISALLIVLAGVGLLLGLDPVYLTSALLLAALWLGSGIQTGLKLRSGPAAGVITMVLLFDRWDFPARPAGTAFFW